MRRFIVLNGGNNFHDQRIVIGATVGELDHATRVSQLLSLCRHHVRSIQPPRRSDDAFRFALLDESMRRKER